MEKHVDLSIIIVSFNTKQLTENCLTTVRNSLKNSKLSYEVIVVDNVSTDGTREMITRKFPHIITKYNSDNVGFGRANNQGIKIAKGEYIFLLNSDTETLVGSIEKLYNFARQNQNSFVGGKLYNLDRSPQTSCGPFLSLPVVFTALFLLGDRLKVTRKSPDKTTKTDWISGACIMGPKKLFMDGLLFDEKIFMYMEEIDLLFRAKKKGYQVWFYPDAGFIHLGGGSSTTYRKQPVLNIYRGLLFFYQKHYSRLEYSVLKVLLRSKALLAWCIGTVIGNKSITETYDEAYHLV